MESKPEILFINRDIYLRSPNDIETYTTWQYFLASTESYSEVASFCRLSEGCESLLDIGAAQGLFSSIFSKISPHAKRIVAIEPAQEYCDIHKETASLNGRDGLDWQVHKLAVSDQNTRATLETDVLDGHFRQYSSSFDVHQPIEIATLDSLCSRINFVPDLIKIDIDSFEHEVFHGSPTFLAVNRPKVHL